MSKAKHALSQLIADLDAGIAPNRRLALHFLESQP